MKVIVMNQTDRADIIVGTENKLVTSLGKHLKLIYVKDLRFYIYYFYLGYVVIRKKDTASPGTLT